MSCETSRARQGSTAWPGTYGTQELPPDPHPRATAQSLRPQQLRPGRRILPRRGHRALPQAPRVRELPEPQPLLPLSETDPALQPEPEPVLGQAEAEAVEVAAADSAAAE